jgi:threonylcarbamoyladenosine tRNA methylthiotransferase MtaB
MLRILSAKKKRAFYNDNIGKSFPVLFEGEKNNDKMFGFTSNYVKVKTNFNETLINEVKQVTLKEIDRDGLFLVDIHN